MSTRVFPTVARRTIGFNTAHLTKNQFCANSFLTLKTRAMSVTAGKKFEFLVVVPDFPGALEKRLEVRPKHFEGLKSFVESGTFKTGGAILEEVPVDDDPKNLKFLGSTFVVTAETKDEVIDIIKRDIYAQSGVWDVEKAQIWPLKTAFRNP